MNDLDVTIDTPYGPVTMPVAAVRSIGELLLRLNAEGKDATWHPNHCGCCWSVHEDVEHPTTGYIVGSDGGYDLIESPE